MRSRFLLGTVASFALALFARTATASPPSLGAPITLEPRVYSDFSAAHGKTSSLVAWTMARPEGGSTGSLRASIVGDDGSIVVPTIHLVDSTEATSIAWGGDGWIVVGRSWARALFADDLVATRVAADGTVLDTTPIMLVPQSNFYRVYTAWDGSAYRVLWGQYDPAPSTNVGFYTARVSHDGAMMGAPVQLDAGRYEDCASMTCAGDGTCDVALGACAVAFDVELLHIAADGSFTKTSTLTASPAQATYPELARLGGNALLAWQDVAESGTTPRNLATTWIDATGVAHDPHGVTVAQLSDEHFARPAFALASDGPQAVLVWQTSDDALHVRRIASDGSSAEPDATLSVTPPTGRHYPTLANLAPGKFLFVWDAENRDYPVTGPLQAAVLTVDPAPGGYDAGPPPSDAGADATTSDGGTGGVDAGARNDAANGGDGASSGSSGCGCVSAGAESFDASAMAALAFVVAALASRRRA